MLTILKNSDEESILQISEEKKVRNTNELFILFALGSQFDHLIKLAFEKLGVFCLVADPRSLTVEDIKKINPTGIVLSGGPASVYEEGGVPFDSKIFDLEIPVLGVCLGFQLWAHYIGATVVGANKREFGVHTLHIQNNDSLFKGFGETTKVLESHGDRIEPYEKFEVLGTTDDAPVSAAKYKNLYGVQFHPETTESENGIKIFENFCFEICKAKDRFPAENIAERKIKEIKETVGDKKVLIALSGGCDSSVVAGLIRKALGETSGKVMAIYIKGIDRPDDEKSVLDNFENESWLQVKVVDATEKFLDVLKGKITMPEKRLVMREVYKEVLEQEVKEFGAEFIAQGTLYTDLSESGVGHDGARRAQIKLHHNTNLGFSVPELMPLADCVKDGARDIGRAIGVREELLVRHPFPGPGLVVRIEGEVTKENLVIARQIDGIYVEELRKAKIYETVWQAGAVVTNSMITCTKGDDASQGVVVALWAVWSVNGFTAQFAELPYEFLRKVSQRITNEVRAVGAVTYRISDKPPSTIEWG
ncbi:MAG: glutamine-hydrolyzing GMP synthase [Patescibacteria group bacterium]